jgi:hypothetical protein
MESYWANEYFMLRDELEVEITHALVQKARRLRLPVLEAPRTYDHDEENEHWKLGQFGWYLTPKGAQEVITAIRGEYASRRDLWLPWLSLVIGVLGAATGFVAILLQFYGW